jgi:hypothetical protein
MEIHLVGTELFHADRRKDRQWDRHDKANSRFFRSCSTAPETLTNNLMHGAHSCCCCVSGLLCPNFSRERNIVHWGHFLIDGRCSPHWFGMLPKLIVNSQRHSVNLRVLSALVWGWQLLLSISWVPQSVGDYIYTGCNRRNGPDFGRVFLMLKYTDITQNTYVQSWTVTEIKEREKCGLLVIPRTVPVSWQSDREGG